MERFLFRFGYEAPDEWRNNERDGTDFESSGAVWVSAHSVEEAETIGTGYAERFVAGLFYQAGMSSPGWLQAGYAHWLEPEAQVDTAAAGDLPGVRPPVPLSIETHRLRLRELRPTDFDSVHEYANDPDVIRFMPWGPNTEADTTDFLRRAVGHTYADPRLGYELGITLRDTGEVVGAIGLHRTAESEDEAMLGYCLARAAWGKGYATEAARAMLDYGFGTLGLTSVWAGCDVENTASIRVLAKLGMSQQSFHEATSERRGEGASFMYRIRVSERSRGGAPSP